MVYLVDGEKYSVSYRDLREDYLRYSRMSDREFLENLPKVLHFAVIMAYFKELGNSVLSDRGLIHRLVHLLDGTEEDLTGIRELFDDILKIV